MKFKNEFFASFLALFFLIQLTSSTEEDIMELQNKVEHLIESVLKTVHNFYLQLKAEHKCIPEEVPDKIMATLKNSIDCIDSNERQYQSALLSRRMHQKNFLKCFLEAKKEVKMIMSEIDVNKNYCPENVTEKTYQINVTTSYTKRFKISIKNGLEASKIIDSGDPGHQLCLNSDDNESERREHVGDEEEEHYGYYDEDEQVYYPDSPASNPIGHNPMATANTKAQENEEARYYEDYRLIKENGKTSGSTSGKTFKPNRNAGQKTGYKGSSPKPRQEEKMAALSLEIPLSAISSEMTE